MLDEAKNALRATPKGLEAPRYRVVRAWAGGELREYDAYSVAKTKMSGVADGGAHPNPNPNPNPKPNPNPQPQL